VQTLIAAGADVAKKDPLGVTSLELASKTTSFCNIFSRTALKHHAGILATLGNDPAALVSAAIAHCASLSSSTDPKPAKALPLRSYHLEPPFLWAPPAARASIIAWARDSFIIQIATTIPPFVELPDDCAGDILEYFDSQVTHGQVLHNAMHSFSFEAHAWVRAVVITEVAVSFYGSQVMNAKGTFLRSCFGALNFISCASLLACS
jgi:hypothetical protein